MATIKNENRTFSECPWCHVPGRIIYSSYDGGFTGGYQIGCDNDKCKVRPRTEKITCNNTIKCESDRAITQCIVNWESR